MMKMSHCMKQLTILEGNNLTNQYYFDEIADFEKATSCTHISINTLLAQVESLVKGQYPFTLLDIFRTSWGM